MKGSWDCQVHVFGDPVRYPPKAQRTYEPPAATREDVIALAGPVLRHRLLLSFAAEAEQKSADDAIAVLLRGVPYLH